MNFFQKLTGKKEEFRIRYSKSTNEWQVYKEQQILYIGSKELCERFVKNTLQPA